MVKSGLSTHAPYSVCPPALAAAGAVARAEGWPLAIHLAESPEERDLLINGEGALLDLFDGLASGADPSAESLRSDLTVGSSAIVRAQAAGLLGPATLAIHANLPESGEARLLAESGSVVVFCPCSHAFFGYTPYSWAEYRRHGVRLALGTDSLASNDQLSIRAELRALARLAPSERPRDLLGVATGAALGQAPPYGNRGWLTAGTPARWALWRLDGATGQISDLDETTLFAALLDPQTRLARSSAMA